MKLQFRKGFTLVEIMIVVVIIGLLAALAIPAFKKVRNNAVEKSIINDGRQVSAGFNQYLSENPSLGTAGTNLGNVIGTGKFFAGLSSGNIVYSSAATTAVPTIAATQPAFNTITLVPTQFFAISNPSYLVDLSGNLAIAPLTNGNTAPSNSSGTQLVPYPTGATYLFFTVDTGVVTDSHGNTLN